jgi:hypothetical protein
MMTPMQIDRWDTQIYRASNRVTWDNKQRVGCSRHGAMTYTWAADSTGYVKLCDSCLDEFGLNTTRSPEHLGDQGPFVCTVQTCYNDAEPKYTCIRCKEMFCIVHMEDDGLCTDCEENEQHELPL